MSADSSTQSSGGSRNQRAGGSGRGQVITQIGVLLIIYAVARVGELIPQLAAIPIVKILLVVGVLAVLARTGAGARPALKASRLATTVGWFFGLGAVSVGFSVFRAQSLAFVIGPLIAVAGVSWVLYSTAALNGGESAVRYFSALASCGAILAAAILIGGGTGITGRAELQNSSYDSNDLAFVVVGVLPLMLARAQRRRGVWRIVWLGSSAAAVWVVLLTQSRGGLLALAAMTVTLTWSGMQPPALLAADAPRAPNRRMARIVALVALAAIAYLALPPATRARLETIASVTSDYNVTEVKSGRVAIWGRGLSALAERPWGVGIDAFEAAEGMQGGQYRAAHNMYLEVLTELGLVGGFLFIRLWWLAWASATKYCAPGQNSPSSPPNRELVMDVYMTRPCIIGLLVGGFFLSQGYAILSFSVIAIIAGVSANAPRASRDASAAGASRRRFLSGRTRA